MIALLGSSDQFIMADLYTITLVGGSVLRYSAAPTVLIANGYTFALGPKFERSKTKVVIGTQVDELEVMLYPGLTDLKRSVVSGSGLAGSARRCAPAARASVHANLWRYEPGNRRSFHRPHLGH